jgi:hypothetical protein
VTVPDLQLTIAYQYDSTKDNVHFNHIEGFSTAALSTMGTCEGGCPYPEFEIFDSYYLLPNYADHIITAVFEGVATNTYRGNMNFTLFGDDARAGTKEATPKKKQNIRNGLLCCCCCCDTRHGCIRTSNFISLGHSFLFVLQQLQHFWKMQCHI